MMMLGSTEGGDAYTFKELDAMFRDAGIWRERGAGAGAADADPDEVLSYL